MALAFGIWVVAYVGAHRTLGPSLPRPARATAVARLSIAAKVLILRVRRGPRPRWPSAPPPPIPPPRGRCCSPRAATRPTLRPSKRRFGESNLAKTVPYVLKNASCRVMLFREHREQRDDETP